MDSKAHRHVVTKLDAKGISRFIDNLQQPCHQEAPFGVVTLIYSATSIPPDVTSDADIQETSKLRSTGLPESRIVLDRGVAAHIVDMKPLGDGVISPMHRTRTLDLGVVIEGEVDLELDGQEVRRLKQGDTIIQRGTMHKWINVTPESGWARVFFVSLDALPASVAGKALQDEWNFSG